MAHSHLAERNAAGDSRVRRRGTRALSCMRICTVRRAALTPPHAHSPRRAQDQHEAAERPSGALALLVQHAGRLSGFELCCLSLSNPYIDALFESR